MEKVRQSEVAERVIATLNEDERTQEFAIEVIDNDGLVTLKGTVDAQEVRQAAVEIAQKQEGVIEVVDELKVDETELSVPPARVPPTQRQ